MCICVYVCKGKGDSAAPNQHTRARAHTGYTQARGATPHKSSSVNLNV